MACRLPSHERQEDAMYATAICAARSRHHACWTVVHAAAQFVFAALTVSLVHVQSATAGTDVWTSGGPLGAPVNTVAVNPGSPGTVYAGTAGKGVFKSYDGGETWWSASVGMGEI